MEVDAPRTGGDEVTWPYARPVALLLAVLIVVGVAAGVWSFLRPASGTQQLADARPDAVAAASRFAVSYSTFDATDVTAYENRVAPLLTPSYAEKFKTSAKGLLALYAKTKLKSTGKVQQAAVESIDSDSAEVLVAVDATTVPAAANTLQWSWQVSLVKQDGRWLVDKYQDIEPSGGTTGAGS